MCTEFPPAHLEHKHGSRDEIKPNRVDTKDLLRAQKELIIVHDGQDYRLRITRNNKLILTK